MPDFDEIQKALFATRTAHDAASRALFRVDEQLKKNAQQLSQIERWFNPNNPEHLQTRERLTEAQKKLQGQKQENQAAVDHLQGQLANLYPQFWEEWTDPRQHTVKMNDDFPVMLFPLRLETRFKTVGGRDGQRQQLWVRVYPDDCLVDTFEETLSQTELKSAGIFWREYFRAAAVDVEERATWRALVASHGAGRAGWIIKHYRPTNPLSAADSEGDATLPIKPQSKTAGELILVITADSNLTLAERAGLQTYWVAIWRAQNDLDLQTIALNALVAVVGADRAAVLVKKYQPYNLSEKLAADYTYATVTVSVTFVYLPDQGEIDNKTQSWMKPAQAKLLPERLVLLGYRSNDGEWQEILNQLGNPLDGPFSVSLDPNADTESQFKFDEHGNLIIGDELRWMMDFDEAVRRGMGFRVNLNPEQAPGFDRLFVLGVRLGSDAEQSKTELETLFKNHYFSRSGFAFLPQGSPTNNTEDSNSAYTRQDDADESFDFYFKGKAEFSETEDWLDKSDGQWFAESLGLDTDWLKQIPHAGDRDQCEARAMNTALWPATLGYFMDTLLQPVFNDDEIYYTRWFFNRFVLGRGMLPAIRIGRQPYGILPTSDFDRIGWVFGDERLSYLDYVGHFQEQRGTEFKDWLWKFKGILDNLVDTWTALSTQVARVEVQPSTDRDPHQTLLDILGLHPASVEFYQRYANTKKQEHNIALIWHKFISWQTLPANELHNQAFDKLRLLGYDGLTPPQLFDLFWKVSPNKLLGPVIQEGPLSESEALRIATDNNRNYIQWLYEWARLSFDTVRVQDGFKDNKSPNTLLYVLLKHALELGYYDAGVRAMDDAQLLDNQSRLSLRSEPHFFHIETASAQLITAAAANTPIQDRSRYELLYTPSERITGDPQKTLVDYLTANLGKLFATRYLDEQLRALNHLQQTPTARLERLLAEHLDCCSYRLDAWMTGLINFQLASMRFARRGDDAGVDNGVSYRKGLYLGAYGWLEDVRPENKVLNPISFKDQKLDEIFNQQIPDNQKTPLVSDSTNQGYIHAPSVNHAVTAAVLRNGFIANANDQQADLLKVNLSSERVRMALNIIEGIRNGQNLAALLGYQFERGLHDRYIFAEADQFIYPLRMQFPLYTNTKDFPEGVSIEAVEARNVVNGMNLIRHIKNVAAADKVYPFGFGLDKLPFANAAQQLVINTEVDRLLDLYDAVADLAIAEGVHQVVMGNYDRAAATLDAYGQATFPPIPDVVQTPRSGIGLTHRVAVHFDSKVAVAATDNPRVKAEPAMNDWLAARLPAANSVACKVTYPHPITSLPVLLFVTQAQLELQPLDMLYVLNPDNLDARSELEDRVRHYVMQNSLPAPLPDAMLEIGYAQADANQFSFFEVAPMIRSLRALLLRSKPLRATDAALPTEAGEDSAGAMQLDKNRVAFLNTDLTAFDAAALQPLLTQLSAVFPVAGPVTATILANIDNYVEELIDVCKTLALYGLPQTSFGIFMETKASIFNSLRKLAEEIDSLWQAKADAFDGLIAALPAPPDPERVVALLKAGRLISTSPPDPTGKTVLQLQLEIQAVKIQFDIKKAQFAAFGKNTETQLSQALSSFNTLMTAAPPYADFDLQPASAADIEKAIVVLAEDIYNRLKQLTADLHKRLAIVDSKLAEYDIEADADQSVQLLTDAAKMVFGDEFILVPGFSVPEKQGGEWTNAYADRDSLLNHQKNVIVNTFPVDDWLYGAARVREKMHHLENLLFLTEALQTDLPEMRPIQLPFDAGAPWLALEFPEATQDKLNRENLLYTALYAGDFNQAEIQCGLLLDEWTEVIPAQTETTGITFHFDKPNAEPPQTILLATPTQFNGAWQWDDLVNTLHSTLDQARIRGVEPQQLDKTELSVFLPATILATTWRPISIGADLAIVNNFVNKAG